MAPPNKKKDFRTTRLDPYLFIKECLKNYTKLRRHAALTGDYVIDHSYIVYTEDGTPKEKVTVVISFLDLLNGIKKISPRKREALWWGVILDKKQEEVGRIMGCRPVTCGQYSNSACQQLAKDYFYEETEILQNSDKIS